MSKIQSLTELLILFSKNKIQLLDMIKEKSHNSGLKRVYKSLGDWIEVKEYGWFLDNEELENNEKNLKKFMEEQGLTEKKKKEKKQKQSEGSETGSESESEEEMEEEEDESDESESETETEEEGEEEGEAKLSSEELEMARLLAERIKREREQEQRKSEKIPREPVVRYTTKPVEGEVPEVLPALMPTDPYRYITECKKEYRSAVWLNTPGKRVTGVYTDNPDYGTSTGNLKYEGKIWYMANDAYFKLQCTSSNKSATKNGMEFRTPSGDVVKINILYSFSDDTYEKQTLDMYKLELNYFIEKLATPEQKKDLLCARPFFLEGGTSELARRIGRGKLAIPNGDKVEEDIAKLPNPTIRDYFLKISSVYSFLEDNSVFAQRVKYYKDVDILTVPKYDYPILTDYYTKLIQYEVEEMCWDLYYMEYTSSKAFKKAMSMKPVRPTIENENKDGKKIFYNDVVSDIKTLQDNFKNGNYEVNGKKAGEDFVKIILAMDMEVKETPKVKVKMLDIFDIIRENIRIIRNGEIPKMEKSADACNYCEKHVGENSEFKSVIMNDENESEIVKFCSIKCFNKSPEE